MLQSRLRAAAILPLLFALAQDAAAQTRVTSPEQQFGHPIGADYVLPDYTAFVSYWQRIAGESDRMVLDTIGTTEEGRPQLMAIITSPENHRNLDRYREISRRLALAEGLTDDEARTLAEEGRAVVWIDGGLHATEVLGAQQLMESVYQLVSRDDPETLRILNDVIILAVHANPDGMELVSDWYMRESDPEERSTGGLPRLYQKYVGHDNNRDFYASTQAETENMNRVMYTEWYPQIVYNHHQTGPAGTVMFAPPFRDPFNHNYDPLIPVSIDMVGAAMHDRFLREGKPGVTMRSGANYSTWWNGGLRTTPYFHNMIGLLTETIGNPTPLQIPFIPRRQIPHSDLPDPIEPQTWHFRQSIDYSVTANYAVLDIASRRRDTFLYNIYRMGANAIARGSEDTWTHYPRYVASAAVALRDSAEDEQSSPDDAPDMNARGSEEEFESTLRDPALRDARGYIIPADQPDFLTAAKFVDALLETGVHVHRATSAFNVAGEQYPAGSFVVKTAQAFAPHAIDMFEPQDHPDDIPYPGGPPTPPYDNAGWTLAYQMGVQFDRVMEGFDGPFEQIEGLRAPRPTGGIAGSGNAGLLLTAQANDAFLAVNRLLAAGHTVYRLRQPHRAGSTTYPAGTFYIRQQGDARADAERIARETGLTFTATGARPSGEHTRLEPIRIALWDRYGGSMPSGWTRWILERFEFPFEVVYPQTLDTGDLSQYDAILFVTGAIPPVRQGDGGRGGMGDDDDVPAEFSHMTGNVTAETTIPRLRQYLEAGGTIITIGSSTNLAQHLGLPIRDALARTVDGREQGPPRSEYYVPGSLLETRVNNTLPVAYGMPDRVDVMFDNSPVMRIEAGADNIRPIAWFDSPSPLRSGWAWGERALEGGIAMAEADVGDGHLFLFGPEVLFRAQPHGTFRFVFNGLYSAAGTDARIR
jgi:hypothetical protein